MRRREVVELEFHAVDRHRLLGLGRPESAVDLPAVRPGRRRQCGFQFLLVVLVGDDLDPGRVGDQTVDVIAITVCEEDGRDRLRRDLRDLRQQVLGSRFRLRIDDQDAGPADDNGAVSAGPAEAAQTSGFSFFILIGGGACAGLAAALADLPGPSRAARQRARHHGGRKQHRFRNPRHA